MKKKKNNYLTFIENIRKGNFVLPYCKKCNKNIWPPADICRLCLGVLSIENSNNKIGQILEIFVPNILKHNNKNILMILVEINQLILLGSVSFDQDTIERFNFKHKLVRIKKCGFIDKKIFYEFELCKEV
jgi:hypothetical protein